MGSNLHRSCSVADWNLAGTCNQNAMEQQFKLSHSFSSCQWLLLQLVSRSTTLTCQDRQRRSVLSDLFPNTNREIQTPGDILVHFTQHGAHRMTLCLEQIFPFLFIPFYLSPFIYPLLKHVSLHSWVEFISGIYSSDWTQDPFWTSSGASQNLNWSTSNRPCSVSSTGSSLTLRWCL